MYVNEKRGSSINSSVKIRRVTRKASSYQMIAEEVSSDRRQKFVGDIFGPLP